jgi:hypothetical protein
MVVRELLLQHVYLRESCWVELFEYLRLLPKSKCMIREIDLRGCGVTDAGLIALSKFLRENTTLKTLLLQNVSCQILIISRTADVYIERIVFHSAMRLYKIL